MNRDQCYRSIDWPNEKKELNLSTEQKKHWMKLQSSALNRLVWNRRPCRGRRNLLWTRVPSKTGPECLIEVADRDTPGFGARFQVDPRKRPTRRRRRSEPTRVRWQTRPANRLGSVGCKDTAPYKGASATHEEPATSTNNFPPSYRRGTQDGPRSCRQGRRTFSRSFPVALRCFRPYFPRNRFVGLLSVHHHGRIQHQVKQARAQFNRDRRYFVVAIRRDAAQMGHRDESMVGVER